MKLIKLTFPFIITLLVISTSHPNAQADVLNSAQIDALVERTLKTFDVPGIAVAVIKDDKIIHSKGYGVRSLKTKLPVDERTLFGIASNSKAFTAAALAILVDEKKIKWNDRVTSHIHEFKMYNPYVTEEFTILDLLTHRSGLGLGAGDLMMFPSGSDFTRADVIRALPLLKSTSSFRSQYDYDNNLYIVAGEIVARVSGMSWEEFIEKRLLQPLGMNDSAAALSRVKNRTNLIDAHVSVNGKVQVVESDFSDLGNAAGGINSNIVDMSQWVRMQLNGGTYGEAQSKHIFSTEAQKEMWTPHTIIPTGDGPNPYNVHFQAYGLGWGLADIKGVKQVSHTGGLIGIVTQVTLIPELKLGIIVLTNQQVGQAFSAISNTIKEGYLGMPAVDRVTEYHERLLAKNKTADTATDAIWLSITDQKKSKNKLAIDSTIFVGTYRDSWFGDVVVSHKDNKLMFSSQRSPKLTGEMFFYKGNTFAVKWQDRSLDADAFAIFSLGIDGRPTGMTMAAISSLTDFSFDFQDLDFKLVK